jgi:hypothetical protein
VSLDERPRGSTRPTPKVHYNPLPRTSIEGALANLVPLQKGNNALAVSQPACFSPLVSVVLRR